MTVTGTATASKDRMDSGIADSARQLAPVEHGQDCSCTRCTGFQPGHELRRTHGMYAALKADDQAEIDANADALREALVTLNIWSEAFTPYVQSLAGALLLRSRGLAEVLSKGIANASPTLVRDLITLERRVQSGQEALGLTPTTAAELGVNLTRARGSSAPASRTFDAARLTDRELEQLRLLVAKGSIEP